MNRASHNPRLALTLLSAIAVLVASTAGLQGDEPLEDQGVAQLRLQQLWLAVQHYMDDHQGQAPTEPHLLFPAYVSDPLTFWHPGDVDPPPSTIDNSLPDAPNSARISFDWGDAQLYAPYDRAVIMDNTADNNDGLFINAITVIGVIETSPVGSSSTPTNVTLAQGHLRTLWMGLIEDAMLHDDTFTEDLIILWQAGYAMMPTTFWNPGDAQAPPTDITHSKLDAPDSAQISFEYLGSGLSLESTDGHTVILRDISGGNNAGLGINVARLDGRVELILDGFRGDINADCHIDRSDWSAMHDCLTGPILDDTCRFMNFEADDHLDLRDFAGFSAAFTGSHSTIPDCGE